MTPPADDEDVPRAYVPLDPETVTEPARGTYALDATEHTAVAAKNAENDDDGERAPFRTTKEVGPHHLVAVKSNLPGPPRQVWMCKYCDSRRQHAAAFVEVNCQ